MMEKLKNLFKSDEQIEADAKPKGMAKIVEDPPEDLFPLQEEQL